MKIFQDFHSKISGEVSSKDKEIENLNLELTSLKETIETLNKENSDLKSKISSVNDLVLSTQKKKIDPSPHSEEFFMKVKFQIRYKIKMYKLSISTNRTSIIHLDYFDLNIPEYLSNILNISEKDVNSSISKYIIRKIEKYRLDLSFADEDYKHHNPNEINLTFCNFFLGIPLIKKYFFKEIELVRVKKIEDINFINNKYGNLDVLRNTNQIAKLNERQNELIKLQNKRFEYFLTILH